MSRWLQGLRRASLALLAGTLVACGGGGGGNSGGGNTPPTATFTATPSSGTVPLTVSFDASASTDAGGSITTYAWNFGDGGTSQSTSATASRVYTTAGTYTVTLTVTDNQGATTSTTRTVTADAGGSLTISGRITFDRVPFSSTNSAGLNYAGTSAQPAREVVVELMPAGGGAALATTITDSDGNYAFTAPASRNAFVRARAQAQRTTAPTFNIRVLNNTGGNALYVLDGTAFNTGAASQTKNLHAASGWGGSGYTSARAAAPFAILDTLYAASRFVHDNGASVNLPALDAFWSPLNNTNDGNFSDGDISSTLYQSAPGSPGDPPQGIYVLGLENNDTDEYDEHVMAHEFQHYLEENLSRTDTPGGSHSQNERLDLRLALSEGFANAFSGMVLNDPVYRDSLGSQQSQSFFFNMEANSASPAGWFSEASIQSLVWDLYDTAADAPDSIALGYQPIYEVLVGAWRTTPALTSVYPFLTGLKARGDVSSAAVNSLATAQNIRANDAWGTGETNSGSVSQALPIYTDVAFNAGPVAVCGSAAAGTFNQTGNRRFLRFSLGATQTVAIRALYTGTGSDPTGPQTVSPDPDIVLWRNGFLDISEEVTVGDELLTRSLTAGEYVIEIYEWSHIDPSYSAAQRRGVTCFDVSVTG